MERAYQKFQARRCRAEITEGITPHTSGMGESMGDYTKVIINCSIKKLADSEVEAFKAAFLEKAYLCSSAYHCGGELFEIQNDWHHRTDISFITQLKYGRGLEEFIDWLRPQVTNGMGDADAFGISFTEYQKEPTLYFPDQTEKDPQ